VRLWAEAEIRKNLVVIKTFFKLADDFFCAEPTVNMFRFAEQSGRTRRENQRLVLRSFLKSRTGFLQNAKR
jgi:hypothetical protein